MVEVTRQPIAYAYAYFIAYLNGFGNENSIYIFKVSINSKGEMKVLDKQEG